MQENGDDREYNDIVTVGLKLFNTDGTAISYREVRQILQLLHEHTIESKRLPLLLPDNILLDWYERLRGRHEIRVVF